MRTGRFDHLFACAAPRPYWLDAHLAPEPCPPVAGEIACEGRRSLYLRALDRLGLRFDS
ncbi:MAG TPA: hypothetical protein VFD90_06890 [Gaiellales bacterium]|nr:hypothetical protein [Gaiellales bacterium]